MYKPEEIVMGTRTENRPVEVPAVIVAPAESHIGVVMLGEIETHMIGDRIFYHIGDNVVYEDWGAGEFGRVRYVKKVSGSAHLGKLVE